jgi:tetratricopeptide (TPR) repeat protein
MIPCKETSFIKNPAPCVFHSFLASIFYIQYFPVMKNLFIVVTILSPLFCFSFNVDSSQFYVKEAVRLQEDKKPFDADRTFQKAIYFNPSDVGVRLQYCDFLLRQRKYQQAQIELVKMASQDKSNLQVLEKLIQVDFYLHKWPEIIEYGTQLLTISSSSKTRYSIGRAYYEEEDYGMAEAMLKQVIKEDPKNLEAIILQGKVLIELSNYKEAIKVYDQALQIDPANATLIYEYGLLHYTSGNEKQAAFYFEKAVETGYKPDLNYKQNLGMAYLKFDIEKGVQLLMEVLQKKPRDEEILWTIADAYYKAKSFQVAASHFYKLYEADKTNAKALYMTGIVYQRMGEKARGGALCDQALLLDPKLSEYVKMIFGR